MRNERKCIYDATENKMVKRYTIKEIFRDNWDDFVDEMEKQGKAIRPTIMEEVAKIIGCQDPSNGFALYSQPFIFLIFSTLTMSILPLVLDAMFAQAL